MPDEYFGKKNDKWDWENFKNTLNFPISDKLIDWIVGQDKAMQECRLCIDEWVYKLTYLKKKKIRQDVAVTGEINLGVDGQVMITPIGGTHEKIMAAQRWGFSKVLIPKKNYENDIIPDEYKIKVVGCATIEEYMKECFINNDQKKEGGTIH